MIKSITSYKTADGKVFQTDQQAERHADELLLHSIERLLNHCFTDANRPSIIKAVEKLHENKDLTKSLLSETLYLFNFGNDDDE